MSRLTTLGVTFGYGVETEKGVKPTTFKQLELASLFCPYLKRTVGVI